MPKGIVKAEVSRELQMEFGRLLGGEALANKSPLSIGPSLDLGNFKALTGVSPFSADKLSGGLFSSTQFVTPRDLVYRSKKRGFSLSSVFPKSLLGVASLGSEALRIGADLLVRGRSPAGEGEETISLSPRKAGGRAGAAKYSVQIIGDPSAFYGYVPKIKAAAEFALVMWRHIIEETTVARDPLGRVFADLRGVKRFEFNFIKRSDLAPYIRLSNLSVDGGTLSADITVGENKKILENLTTEGILLLIIWARKLTNGSASLGIKFQDMEVSKGRRAALYRAIAREVRRFSCDESNALAVLKDSLRRGREPPRFRSVLKRIGYGPEVIDLIVDTIKSSGAILTDVVRSDNRRSGWKKDGVFYFKNFSDSRTGIEAIVAGGDESLVADFNEQQDIYSLFARAILLRRFFRAQMLQYYWEIRKADLDYPMAIHGIVKSEGERPKEERVSVGKWDEEWIDRMMAGLSSVAHFAKGNEDEARALQLIRELHSYTFVRDGSVDKLTAYLVYGPGGERSVMVKVPRNYKSLTINDLMRSLENMVSYGFVKTPVEQTAANFTWSRLELQALFDRVLAEVAVAGGGAFAIEGEAAREVKVDMASAFRSLWSLGRSGNAPEKGAVLKEWLKGQRLWMVKQIEKDRDHQIIIEKRPEGLLVVVRGEAPSPAQWIKAILSAFLKQNGTLRFYLDSGGGMREGSAETTLNAARELLYELRGVNRSMTFGAERNPKWVREEDQNKKDNYVDALRWFSENRSRLPETLVPDTADSSEGIKSKYRTFSKLFHPDRNPQNKSLFQEGGGHYKVMISMATD